MHYRPEIDGLRAIAVISVIAYHAQFILFEGSMFRGGFIGVDIFFVISGYLITRIIVSELTENDSFSFANFYERRARRILPLVLTVALCCLFIAWQILLPADFVALSKSILAAISFWSNFYFYNESIQYGAENSLVLPFLHTWSLSVEEQVYLVLPLIVLITHRYFNGRFLIVMLGFLVFSIIYSSRLETVAPNLNFFSTVSRFWEIAVGSILALIELSRRLASRNQSSNLWPILGLCLITYSILFFNQETPHPSLYTLIPIIGVALIINFSTTDDLTGRLLASKPLVGIGLISYSLYLWHYPIMAFGRIISNNPTGLEKFVWIVVTLLLSIASYFLIEKQFRTPRRIPNGIMLITLSITSLVVGFSCFAVMSYDGYEKRVPLSLQKTSFDDRFANIHIFAKCHTLTASNAVEPNKFCTLGEYEKNVYLVGDSHMVSIAFKLADQLSQIKANLVIMTRSGKILGRGRQIDLARLEILNHVKNEVVILGGRGDFFSSESFDRKTVKKTYSELIQRLNQNGNTVLLVYPVPPTNIHRKGLAQEFLVNGRLLDKKSSRAHFDQTTKEAYSFYDDLKYENVTRIYPSEFFCDSQNCYGVREGVILISDVDHPSSASADWISKKIIESLVISHL